MKEFEIKCEPITPGYYLPPEWQNEVLDENLNIIQERKILKESEFVKTGEPKIKYNIYYYNDGVLETKEFHSNDGVSGNIKEGYILKTI